MPPSVLADDAREAPPDVGGRRRAPRRDAPGGTSPAVRAAQSRAADARQAAREFHAGVLQDDIALVLFHCSSAHDLPAVAAELTRLFGDTPVVGCTSAAEIGPAGYVAHSLSGVSLGRRDFTVAHGLVEDLPGFGPGDGLRLARRLVDRLGEQGVCACSGDSFGLLLIDGLSGREEPVANALQCGLGSIRLVGGSAGDDLRFRRSHVFADGAFRPDCALLVLVSTTLPFRLFKTQHFVAGEQRMVVTEADPQRRRVREIDGLPAAARYARLLGLDPATLGPQSFAASPVVVMIGGAEYVRAIQRVEPDGSLAFFCAIEEGLVLRVAHGVRLFENLEQTFDGLCRELGPLQLSLVFDCILRTVELEQLGRQADAGALLRRHRAVGFAGYGEQFQGVHVNQTLTGVAFGARPA